MAAKKETPQAGATPWDAVRRLVVFCLGPGRPLTILVLVLGSLYGAWYGVWYGMGVGQKVMNSPEYRLALDGLEITPPPAWIKRDVRREAYDHARLGDPLLILDDRLLERLRNVFSLHPWVAKVRKIQKFAPARVQVELDYRRPVCMVEVPGGLYPVDAQGTWLPSDFTPIEATQYPRLSGIDTAPIGSVGTRWGDARVVGGAEIADALSSDWLQLQLTLIRPQPSPSPDQCTFDLYTRGGTRILWGRAPGMSPAGEIPAAEKVARLRRHFEEHNTLDSAHGPQEIDVRAPQGLQVGPRTIGQTK
jgi:hypothetical protein